MEVTFSYKYMNLLILLIGLVIILYFISKRFTRERMLKFGNFEVLEKISQPGKIPIDFLSLLMRILTISLIVIAISNVEIAREEFISNTDFVLAVDTSSSMLTPDYEPNRLELAKNSAIDWIRRLKDTRVGVVTFSGRSYTKIEPTTDLERVENIIRGISLEHPAGTAIGESLITASSLLHGSDRNKTIILITDGRNNIGVDINESLKLLKEEGIRIIAIGIGSKKKGSIRVPAELVGKNATASEFPELDEETLLYIANETNGEYFYIEDPESFRRAFESGVKLRRVTKNINDYLLLAACAILMIEWAFDITKYRVLP